MEISDHPTIHRADGIASGDQSLNDFQLPLSHMQNSQPIQRGFSVDGGMEAEDGAGVIRRYRGGGGGAGGGSRSSSLHPLEQIERSLPHKLMLQQWREEEGILRMQIHSHESTIGRIEHGIYQIFGFDLVFQAILVAAASEASVLDCSSAWVPLVLSIAASLATFLALFRKLDDHERLDLQLQSERSDARVLFEYVERLKTQGDQFDLSDLPHTASATGRKKMFPTARDKVIQLLWSYKFLVLIVFFVCSILVVVSFKKILCSS